MVEGVGVGVVVGGAGLAVVVVVVVVVVVGVAVVVVGAGEAAAWAGRITDLTTGFTHCSGKTSALAAPPPSAARKIFRRSVVIVEPSASAKVIIAEPESNQVGPHRGASPRRSLLTMWNAARESLPIVPFSRWCISLPVLKAG